MAPGKRSGVNGAAAADWKSFIREREKDMTITLEQLTHENYDQAAAIDRDDIPEEWVDSAASLMEVTDYGAEHHLIGHTFLARADGKPAGLIMIGEALAWDTDPEEMKGKPFYRVMGFVVDREYRGRGIGEALVRDCLGAAKALGFRILQFNAVVESNARARRLYEKLGFHQLGVIPGGFRMSDGHYENICPYSIEL